MENSVILSIPQSVQHPVLPDSSLQTSTPVFSPTQPISVALSTIKQILINNTPTDVERPATQGPVTVRPLDPALPENKDIPIILDKVLTGVINGNNDYFDPNDFTDPIKSLKELERALSELIIRFDTNPEYYTKKDYQLLLSVLVAGLLHLYYSNTASEDDIKTLTDQLESYRKQYEKAFSDVNERVDSIDQNKQNVLIAGTGIQISDDVVTSIIGDDIDVGVNIGNLQSSALISKTTPVLDLLKQILEKIIDVVPVYPTIKITTNSNNDYLFGDIVSNQKIKIEFIQGYFQSEDPVNWSCDNQVMDCKILQIQNPVESTWTGDEYTIPDFQLTDTTSFKAKVKISDNTVTPMKNNGQPSDKYSEYVPNLELESEEQITFIPKYKVFLGSTQDTATEDSLSNDKIQKLDTSFVFDSTQSQVKYLTKSTDIPMSMSGRSIIIACPEEFYLENITLSDGVSVISFFKHCVKTLTFNGANKDYNVYLWDIPTSTIVDLKNVLITKKLV